MFTLEAETGQTVRELQPRGFALNAEPACDEGMTDDRHQLFALCKHYGMNHLIYAGFAINWCLLLSPGGMAEMSRYGIICSAIPQAVTRLENKETARAEFCKQVALWRVALAFGFSYDLEDLIKTFELESEKR